MSSRTIAALLAAVAVVGCDREGVDLLPALSSDYPTVVDGGELQVLDISQVNNDMYNTGQPWDWCAHIDDNGAARCHYGILGAPNSGEKGGVTFNFKGTGDKVCVVVDPETVFWNQSIAPQGQKLQYAYPDTEADDGDLDLFAGLSAYYTGSPGVELGDFTGYYTNSQGVQIAVEFSECTQASNYSETNPHAGRATVEYCTVDTSERRGIDYTVLLQTFSVPEDDGAVSYGAMVVNGSCTNLSPDECTIRGESLDAPGQLRTCTEKLELAYCNRNQYALTRFCCANPEMCGDVNIPDTVCSDVREMCCNHPSKCGQDQAFETCSSNSTRFDRDEFCAAFPEYCCNG